MEIMLKVVTEYRDNQTGEISSREDEMPFSGTDFSDDQSWREMFRAFPFEGNREIVTRVQIFNGEKLLGEKSVEDL